MRIPKRWAAALGAASLVCMLTTGLAFARGGEPATGETRPSTGMQEVLREIRALHRTRAEQFRAEVDALIDRAQAKGKITKEEAARLKESFRRPGDRAKIRGLLKGARTVAEVRARLQEAVKDGRLTQEQADRILRKWQDWHGVEEEP